jgi:hypothetical protein
MRPALPPVAEPPSQDRLARLHDERAAWVGSDTERADTAVLVLLRAFDLADLVYGARVFAAGLPPDEAGAWRRSWSMTRFLFGNPANLTERTPARVIAPGGSAVWLGPFPAARPPGLSRLLKPVGGVLPVPPAEIEFPGRDGAAYRELRLAVRDLTLAEYLVHLHHTLTESVLLGRLRPDEPLRLVHCLDLDARTAQGTPGYARVHHAHGDPSSLRLYAWLSPR